MERYLFTVNTEYHLLLAISIIVDLNEEQYCEHDVILLDGKAKRLRNVNAGLNILGIRFERIDLGDRGGAKEIVRRLSKKTYKAFFHFTEFNTINSYFVSRLRRRTRIMLVEDGTAIYQTYDVKAYGSRFKQTVRRVREAIELGLWHFPVPIEQINHRPSKRIDTLWLTHPELYPVSGQRVHPIRLLDTITKKELSNYVFGVEPAMLPQGSVVLYLGRVSYSEEYLDFELRLIEQLIQRNPTLPFYLKPHPLSTEAQLSRYKTVVGLNFIDFVIPAELLIANLEYSKIFAVDSTCLYFYNPSCQYTELYTYFQQHGVYPSYRHIPFPDHVMQYG